METITKTHVLAMLREIVNEYGRDYVYEKKVFPSNYSGDPIDTEEVCVYVHEGQFDCIAGHVFSRLGVSQETLSLYERRAAGSVIESLGLPFTKAATAALNEAQIVQDDGDTWGKALEAARRPMWGQVSA